MEYGEDAQLDILRGLYPEMGAGGFSHVDGTIEFYVRVNALLQPAMSVVDYGAGRGEWTRDAIAFRRDLRTLRGKVKEVIGADVDHAVMDNPAVDRYVICPDLETIPLDDHSVDMVVADHTFEHIDHPAAISAEMDRILRPGGWICARTPNKWGYVAAAASLVPNRKHVRALHRLQPARESEDVFPTRYRLNTLAAINEFFPESTFENYSYFWAGDPAYFGRSAAAARLLRFTGEALPGPAKPKLFVFLRKAASGE